MSANGAIQGDYASLSGKIHTLVIDKTLSIGGAAADAKATGDELNAVRSEFDGIDLKVMAAESAAKQAQTSANNAASALTKTYKREEVLTDATKALFGLDASKTPDDILAALSSSRVANGSYVGTGTSEDNGEVTLTFDFAPKVLILFGAGGIIRPGRNTDYTFSADSSLAIGYPQALTTSFARGLFVNDYGISGGGSGNILAKRSDDGKSVTWKTTASWYEEEYDKYYYYPAQGYNYQGVTYYYVAIG